MCRNGTGKQRYHKSRGALVHLCPNAVVIHNHCFAYEVMEWYTISTKCERPTFIFSCKAAGLKSCGIEFEHVDGSEINFFLSLCSGGTVYHSGHRIMYHSGGTTTGDTSNENTSENEDSAQAHGKVQILSERSKAKRLRIPTPLLILVGRSVTQGTSVPCSTRQSLYRRILCVEHVDFRIRIS